MGRKSREDFALARSALRRKKPLITGACFHAQQCAEKYINALLVSKDAEFPKTHDLLMLNNLCSDIGILLEVDPMLLNHLADDAVRTRYPGEEPTLKDAKEAMEITKIIRTFARKFLSV